MDSTMRQLFLVLVSCLILVFWATTASSALPVVELNACYLNNRSMYCTCDEGFPQRANQISCSVVSELLPDDPTWASFSKQRNITHLTIISRVGSKLEHIPTAILKHSPNLKSYFQNGSNVEILWPYTFDNMTKMETIRLENNAIRIIEPYSIYLAPNLVKLSLSRNEIQRITKDALFGVPKLRELHMDHNKISVIDNHTFRPFGSLEQLMLRKNEIHNINFLTFMGLRNLTHLSLHGNRLHRLEEFVFSEAPQLRVLDLSHNSIEYVSPDAFGELNHLEALRLDHNRIKALPNNVFSGSPNLRIFNVTKNRLTTFQRHILDPLEHGKNQTFIMLLKDNPLVCSCDLLWISKYALAATNHIIKRELKHLRCRHFTEPNHTAHVRLNHLTQVLPSCIADSTIVPFTKTTTVTTEYFYPPKLGGAEETFGDYERPTTEGSHQAVTNKIPLDFNKDQSRNGAGLNPSGNNKNNKKEDRNYAPAAKKSKDGSAASVTNLDKALQFLFLLIITSRTFL